MASRYWVGGSGNWSSTSHWSTASGGSSGAAVPTSSDDVILDGHSGTGTVTVDAASVALSVTMGQPGLNLTLAASLTVSGVFQHNNATLTTAGFALAATALASNSGLTRAISLGSSTVTLGAGTTNLLMLDLSKVTGLTFTAGTSSIVLAGDSTGSTTESLNGVGITFYDLTYTGAGDFDLSVDGATFHNFTRIGTSQIFTGLAINATTLMTVTGTLTLHGNSRQNSLMLRSGANYITTIINAAAVDLQNLAIFDIIAQGAAAPWSGTALGDGQGNTGITFAAPRQLFWVGNSGNWSDSAHWSLTSGGSSGQLSPLAQDDVRFDASSITVAAQTVTCDVRHLCRDFVFTGLANTLTVALPNVSTWSSYGNITLNANLTLTAPGGEWQFRDQRSPSTITCNGATIPGSTRVSLSGSTHVLQLGGDATFSGKILNNGGLFDTQGFALSCGGLAASSGGTTSFVLHSSTITLTTGTLDASVGSWTGMSTASLIATAANPTFQLAGLSWGSLTFTSAVTGTGTGAIIGNDSATAWNPVASTVASLSITGPANLIGNYSFASPLVVTGALTINGNSVTNRLLVASITPGRTAALSVGSIGSLSNVDFRDIQASGATPWTGTSIGDCQGNSGITVTTPAAASWVGATSGTGVWGTAANWSSGRVPLPQDDVTVSGAWSASSTISLTMPRLGRNIDFSGMSGANSVRALNASNSGFGNSIYGSLTLSSKLVGGAAGASFAVAADLNLRDRRGGSTVTWAGVQPSSTASFATIQIAAPGGDYTFQDVLTVGATTRLLTLQSGTLKLNNLNHTVGGVVILGQIARTMNFGSGTLSLSGTGTSATKPVWDTGTGASAAANLTLTGTGIIDITDTSSTAKTFAGGSMKGYPTVRHRSTGTGGLVITGNNQFVNLDIECSTARPLTLPALGAQTVTGTLTLQGASGQTLSSASSSSGVPTWIRKGSATTVTQTFHSPSGDVRFVGTGIPIGLL